ncbi:metal dependent phosphohydrolase [Bartonella apihabitans]|uniref:HD domain-containing protein n=1 Tax=Bartonella apihabitans TaxID=2750929 RepID=UPI00098FC1A4|nr:HD domain-containing protein [Bartonella apihabitans]AQT44829.1 metal dependent phosphohydrolase [Bartonella apihabitans]
MAQIKVVQRVRDPLHDLIEFNNSELETALWDVIQTEPFQRLRRVKQLGFSDLVYPGATHSRFAHSLGVFHTARQLMQIIRRHTPDDHASIENRAIAAALVHDVGHGAFSHAFEDVGKQLKIKLASHEDVSDELIRSGEISEALNSKLGSGFANDVADIINKNGVKTLQHAVVSSQFDADRLDYMRRDRLMTGTQHAAIDFPWLIANLEVASVNVGVDEEPTGTVETFVLGPKAIPAAEAYVLGLFQLYPTVYFHKATRGAEKLFIELLLRLVTLVKDGDSKKVGLPNKHPLIKFAKSQSTIQNLLDIDDSVIWGALSLLSESDDQLIADFASRLKKRNLFKCYDVRVEVSQALNPRSLDDEEKLEKVDKCCVEIQNKISEWKNHHEKDCPRILIDRVERNPYKSGSESKGPLDRINIKTETGDLVDLKECSNVVSALKVYKLLRVYMGKNDTEANDAIHKIVAQEIEHAK